MADEFDDLLGEDLSTSHESNEFLSLVSELDRRCKNAGIQCEITEPGPDEDGLEMRASARIWFPAGKDKRKIHTSNVAFLTDLLATQFEQITLLDRFDGMLHKSSKRIEARIRPVTPLPTSMLIRRLNSLVKDAHKEDDGDRNRIYWPKEQGITVSIGQCSDDFLLFGDGRPSKNVTFTMAIDGVETTRHDEAIQLLERIFNSISFSLDLNFSTPFHLVNRRLEPRPRPRGQAQSSTALEFPKYEYDAAPMSLYWYAGSARGMPLLQYLAYYQVLEFYFPTYSTREAGRKVQSLLKDPSFRPDRDADITRMLTIISAPKGGGYGSEREQLKAAINECVEETMLANFFEEDETRKAFFSAQQRGLTQKKLNFHSANTDLRGDVADLIYDIRCRIVHTKGTEAKEEKLLLPFSREAELLAQNIELIQFLARRVMIAASTPFRHPIGI